MSTQQKSDRTYVLNVVRQFLQTFSPDYNPLRHKQIFDKLCGANRYGTRCFYKNLSSDAERFLESFQGPALQRIICASIPGGDLSYTFPVNEPVQTPLWMYGAETSSLFATDGIGILRNIAAVTLIAAAFDLCYVKHHQAGMTPA